MEREVRHKKSNENKQGDGGQTYPHVYSVCEKNCPIFQTATRVPSDKLLDSC